MAIQLPPELEAQLRDYLDRKLYYYDGRNTAVVARSPEEADSKKRRGGTLVDVRDPSLEDLIQISKGRWVRTRRDGLPPSKSKMNLRGLGPQPKNWEYKEAASELEIQDIINASEKGLVGTHRGLALITQTDKDGITFVTADKKYPERYRLMRPKKGTDWVMVNITPRDPRDYKKIHYKTLRPSDVSKIFSTKNHVSEKIDGSASWLEIGDHLEQLSYRNSKHNNEPIIHTDRLGIYDTDTTNLPKDTVLRGEIFGERDGKAIPVGELGGILNATIANSLQKQRDQDVKLRTALFDIQKYKGKDVSGDPYGDRLERVREIVSKLPQDRFTVPEGYNELSEQKELFKRISEGKNPHTQEGVVSHPLSGGIPTKVKNVDEYDVRLQEFLENSGHPGHVGSIGYSLPDSDTVVGNVGTGFNRQVAKDLWENKDLYKGMLAKILSEGQFPSGAYRAPSFQGLHLG